MPQVESTARTCPEKGSQRKSAHKTSALYRMLVAQSLTFEALAIATGLKERTLHNVASGTNVSRRARKRIEAALGVKIWPDDHHAPSTTPAQIAAVLFHHP